MARGSGAVVGADLRWSRDPVGRHWATEGLRGCLNLSLLPEESHSLAGSWGWRPWGCCWCLCRIGPQRSYKGWRDRKEGELSGVVGALSSPLGVGPPTNTKNSGLSETQLRGGVQASMSQKKRVQLHMPRGFGIRHSLACFQACSPANSYLPYKTQLLLPSGRRCMPGSFCSQSFSPSPPVVPAWLIPTTSALFPGGFSLRQSTSG